MPVYLVDYDLNSPGQNYSGLIKAIETKFTDHFKIMKSSWFVYDAGKTAQDVFDALQPYIDQSDNIFVNLVGFAGHSGFLRKDAISWLNSKLSLA